jgi:tetratricopeptide (TPR) repeat protein
VFEVWPSFLLPPLSDDWHMFYFIHHLDDLPGRLKWLHILNYDPFEQMRFQPLSRIFYYLMHLAFGANFVYYKIINLVFYFLSALTLYAFSTRFCNNSGVCAACAAMFVFLFNHCDIMLWAHHIYIIFGLLVFLLGFLSYMRFMSAGRPAFFCLSILCFLTGMWCYEPFFLWPFGVLILSGIGRFRGSGNPQRTAPWIMLGVIYIVYAVLYLFTRSLGTYAIARYGMQAFFNPQIFISAVFLTFFNLAYNGILVNILPFLAFPLKVTENVYMGGPVLAYINSGHRPLVYAGGLTVALVLFALYARLRRKRYFEEIKIFGFFFFLLFSVMYTLFFCRLITNGFTYGMTEFRYQYAQNAFLVLMAAFAIDRFVRLSRRISISLFLIASVVLIFNVYCASVEININNEQLSGLRKMIHNISSGMRQGYINESRKLYLHDDIPDYLPSLCWNIEMGDRFMHGTYQWVFSRAQVKYFAPDLDQASWVIDKDDFSVIPKEKMHGTRRQTVSEGKDEQYLNLANYYREQKKFDQAERVLQSAIRMHPEHFQFYYSLGDCYADQGMPEKAEMMNARSEEIQRKLFEK